MKVEALPVTKGNYNLEDYEQTYRNFDWSDVEKNFSFSETGRVNVAHEAIDRHAESARKNKVALYYRDPERDEKYTFKEMKEIGRAHV